MEKENSYLIDDPVLNEKVLEKNSIYQQKLVKKIEWVEWLKREAIKNKYKKIK